MPCNLADGKYPGVLVAEPAQRLLRVIQTTHSLPTVRTVTPYSRLMHAVVGAASINTESGTIDLRPGSLCLVRSGTWCQIVPCSAIRLWTISSDENILRTVLNWCLPDRHRVRAGHHPFDWDVAPLLVQTERFNMPQFELLYRQISLLPDTKRSPESVAVQAIELLTAWVELVIPYLLDPALEASSVPAGSGFIDGRDRKSVV